MEDICSDPLVTTGLACPGTKTLKHHSIPETWGSETASGELWWNLCSRQGQVQSESRLTVALWCRDELHFPRAEAPGPLRALSWCCSMLILVCFPPPDLSWGAYPMQTPQIIIVPQGKTKSLVSAGEGGILRPAHLWPLSSPALINLPSRGQTQLCKKSSLSRVFKVSVYLEENQKALN